MWCCKHCKMHRTNNKCLVKLKKLNRTQNKNVDYNIFFKGIVIKRNPGVYSSLLFLFWLLFALLIDSHLVEAAKKGKNYPYFST